MVCGCPRDGVPFRTICDASGGGGGDGGGVDGKGDGQSCLWWSQACSIFCDECATETAGTTPLTGNPPQTGKIGFRRSYCNSTRAGTLPRHAWTLNMDAVEGADEDAYRFNPWRAPGRAPVVDPCGQAGGEYGYQKLGGDSMEEMQPRFDALRQLRVDELPMDDRPWRFGYE